MKSHKNIRTHSRLYAVLLMLVLLFVVPGCREEEEVNTPAPEIPVGKEDPLETRPSIPFTISGIVVDEEGQPVNGAQVRVHGKQYITAADGRFVLDKIPVPANRCVIQATKTGFYPGIRALTPGQNHRADTRIVLMSSATTHTFSSGSGGNLTLANGSQVKIPANGLVTATGTPYNGQVNMALRYLDPSASGFGFVVSGGDMLARRQDQTTTMLYSYGILRVLMTGAASEPLQLAPGQTATLVVDIPDSQLGSAPATIPLWYFDEKEGIWQEEGEATRQGNTYTGTVKHFTDWNCDQPGGFATIRGRLLDCHGQPAGGHIEFGQITSDPRSSTESGEPDGKFEKRVPSGISLTVVLNDPLLLTPLTDEGRGKLIVVLPPLADGQVYDMGGIKTFPCQADLTAILKTAPGQQVRSVLFISRKGSRSVHPVGENLKASLPPGVTLTMTIFTNQGAVLTQNITIPAGGGKLDLGIIDLTGPQTPKNVVYLTGKLVCNGTPEAESSVEASWQDTAGGRVDRYTSLKADGTFSLELPPNTSVRVRSLTRHAKVDQVVQTSATPGATTDLGTLELCANPAIGESSFVITGDGFDKKLETLPTNKNYVVFSYARYRKGTHPETTVNVNRLSKDLSFTLTFQGQHTGGRDSGKPFLRIERKMGEKTIYYEAGTYVEGSNLQLNITRYGSVGEPVEGTFSGTFVIKSSGGKTVTITNGIFSVLRHPDL